MPLPNFMVRSGLPDDIPLIYDSWLKSYRRDSSAHEIDSNTYFREQQRLVDRILAAPTTTVWVAHKPDEPNVVYGWLVSQGPVLHYSFVKESFTSKGICTALCCRAFGDYQSIQCTHRTGKAKRALARHPEVIYNPYLLSQGDQDG